MPTRPTSVGGVSCCWHATNYFASMACPTCSSPNIGLCWRALIIANAYWACRVRMAYPQVLPHQRSQPLICPLTRASETEEMPAPLPHASFHTTTYVNSPRQLEEPVWPQVHASVNAMDVVQATRRYKSPLVGEGIISTLIGSPPSLLVPPVHISPE